MHRIVMVEVIIRVMIKAKCQSVLGICLHLVLDHIQEMGKLQKKKIKMLLGFGLFY